MTTEKLKALEPIFGSWYVDSKLAEGRTSKVFKVYKTVDGNTEFLALKTVKFPANDRELSRVIESGKYKTVGEYLDTIEAVVTDNMNKMLSLRTNKNIVRFDNFQIIKESSCFYVIMLMELLSPFSEKVKPAEITAERAVNIGCDLCSAVEGFRNIGIMHHQIKPENIYVDSEGNFKLGDFGISNIAGRGKAEASPYMAPEIYKDASVDTSSDIYSIGVLLYKLLNNNRLPFLPAYPNPVSLSDREAAFEKQLNGKPLSAPVKADAEMARIISKALAYQQSDRYFSPLLMKTELERYGEIISSPAEAVYQPVPPPPVYIPVAPASPLAGFHIADEDEEKEEETSIYLKPDTAVSEAEKVAFRQAFKETSEDNDDEDDGKDNKKMYLLVAAIIAVIALIIGIIFMGGKSDSSEENTTVPSVILPTASTTQPSTVPTTVPPTVTTAAPTTTETTSETTTETTAETTTETTTEATTSATTVPTTPAYTGTPELVVSGFSDGDVSADGRVYTAIEDYTIISTPEDEFFDEVILEISTPFGENINASGNVYIYEMSGSSVIQKTTANFEITVTEDDGAPLICCYITVDDGDFYYSPEYYQYYICLEENAIASDSAISLPLQLQV